MLTLQIHCLKDNKYAFKIRNLIKVVLEITIFC